MKIDVKAGGQHYLFCKSERLKSLHQSPVVAIQRFTKIYDN